MKIARSSKNREGRVQEDLDQLHHQLEAALTAQYPPTPPGSPIVLSLAKQLANIIRFSNCDLPEMSSEMMLQRCISDSSSSPCNEGRFIGRHGGDDVARSVSTVNSVPSAPRIGSTLVGMELENAPPPPIWSESTEKSLVVDSELISTYKYPRFLTRDPTQSRLAQLMATTLKHVQSGYWKVPFHPHANINGSDPISATGFMTSDATYGSKSKPKKVSTSSSRGTATTAGTSFQPNATPKNVWSEPSASTMHVRGKTYAKDGVKVESETSLFSVLGVDSFVSGDKSEVADASAATKSYLRRWKGACKELELSCPPFLLIINFIVPWGNFQTYMIRTDSDEGPFSSRHRNRPSEKAWRKFMEGNTEYRNERLKLIPRVCAGPWVVKKVVGSTPALIGTKLPVSYRGSVAENYLEIILDVTKGPALGNSVANTVVGKADLVTVDLGFVIEGQEDGHLPEQMLGLIRYHHLNMSEAPTRSQWIERVL